MARRRMDRRGLLIGSGVAALAAPSLLGARRARAEEVSDLFGRWGAALRSQGGFIRLALDIEPNERGKVDAVLTSIDQGGAVFMADYVSGDLGALEIGFGKLGATALLALAADGQTLAGDWTQGCPRAVLFRLEPDFATLAPPPAAPLSTDHIEALRAAAGSPALIAGRRRDGAAPIGAIAGQRSVSAPVPATLEDVWHVGSITKSMTATLVAAAVEAGVVRWDDTVGGLLGAMAGGEAPEPYRDATFDHLLSHRAGLSPNLPIPELMAYPLEEADPRASRRDYVARALAAPAVAAPGAAFAYSNSGYVLAAAMLESKLDAPWEAIIAERLFAPLGLASAGFGAPDPGPAPDAPQAPVGHTASVGALIGASKRRRPVPPGGGRTDNPAVLAPAGGVHMSLGDLLAYLDAHRLKGPLLQAESWTRLQSPAFGGDYALGWFVKPDGALWHNGSNTLWYAEAVIDPGAGVSAAAAANDGLMACSSIATSEALASARATP